MILDQPARHLDPKESRFQSEVEARGLEQLLVQRTGFFVEGRRLRCARDLALQEPGEVPEPAEIVHLVEVCCVDRPAHVFEPLNAPAVARGVKVKFRAVVFETSLYARPGEVYEAGLASGSPGRGVVKRDAVVELWRLETEASDLGGKA